MTTGPRFKIIVKYLNDSEFWTVGDANYENLEDAERKVRNLVKEANSGRGFFLLAGRALRFDQVSSIWVQKA